MPIDYRIDHAQKRAVARGRGIFDCADMAVWSKLEVADYDELVDMTDVEELASPPCRHARQFVSNQRVSNVTSVKVQAVST